MGFCVFNTVALLAKSALNRGLNRILILDWDVHHGNGTQEAFYDDGRVYLIDLHQENLFPQSSGGAHETGTGDGLGWTLNLPLPHSCRDADYLEVLKTFVQPRVYAYQPELILVSAGFDADISDELGSMSLTSAGYRQMTRLVKEWAESLCKGRLILNLEGGYNPGALANNVFQCAEILSQVTPEAPVDLGETREDLKELILKATP
jgi:acetoin utilization deacetylase AcuC-like enzyme